MVSGGGFALITTLMMVAAVSILCVAMFTMLRYEVATVGAHEREFTADLAVESGLNAAVSRITAFLRRDDVSGAAFTTWAYAGNGLSSHLALTAGRPDKTSPAAPWLSPANTLWLGTAGDPDELWIKYAAEDSSVVDLNEDGKICGDKRPLPVQWQDGGTSGGFTSRYAVWVDDESSRLDLGKIAETKRLAGESVSEIPVFDSKNTAPPVGQRAGWVTEQTARALLGTDSGLTKSDDFLTTVFNTNYRVVQWAPAGKSEPMPSRGKPRRNLNWKGWTDASKPAETRVRQLSDWMRYGAPDFFRYGAPSFWPSASGASVPVYNPPLADVSPLLFVRENQMDTIAASIIDYLDPDPVPTQPAWTSAAAVQLPKAGAQGIHFLLDYDLPAFFGADRCPRINEVQIIWNSEGAPDGFKARKMVQRKNLGGGILEYTIPVTFRFELWNMDKNAIPARAYAVRTFFMQQILGMAFGSLGSESIPESSEIVFLLNNGNPLGFAPNELGVFDFTRTYVRKSNVDRGTTWKDFMNGPDPDTIDDQPDGHQRQAHVLCDPDSGAWYHATCYKQMTETPADGLCSAGIGSSGASEGNKVNDPRMEPLRSYMDAATITTNPGADFNRFYDGERDGASNKPGKIGRVNNKAGSKSFNYQDFAYWIDRPAFDDVTRPSEGVTRVGNKLEPAGGGQPVEVNRFLSTGELGRIFDPGWVHPDGRGGNDTGSNAYHAGCRSCFHGGGTLRVGQIDGRDRLSANSWNILDLFDTDPGTWGALDEAEFLSPTTRGRVNVNVPKRLASGHSVLEAVFALPELFDGVPGSNVTDIDARVLRDAVEARLAMGGNGGVGGAIASWKQCRPFFSAGEMSELAVWENPALYRNKVTAVAGQPAGLNRGDAGREEPFARSAGMVTTFSHCYRFTVAGSVGRRDSSGVFREAARRFRQYVVFYECTFDTSTGKLTGLNPRVLFQKDL